MIKISGYMTCRNAAQMGYPFIEALTSLDNFCDEIVVCDTSDGSDDTTKLLGQFKIIARAEVKIINPEGIDWSAPNHGIYDGMTKAMAREACTGDYCFQIDADEVVVATYDQIKEIVENSGLSNGEAQLIALPVIEPWGSDGKVRADINPWKERLSVNDKNITHGIPGPLRKEENGLLYARQGTDGCNVIYKDSLMPVPCLGFVTEKVNQVRNLATTNEQYIPTYEAWFNKKTTQMPYIYHFSWWSVYEKMLKYKLFWNDSWISLYNEPRPKGYNPFFNKSFDDITERDMIVEASKLEKETGGWIFHSPWDGSKKNWIKSDKPIPEVIETWANKHKTPKK